MNPNLPQAMQAESHFIPARPMARSRFLNGAVWFPVIGNS
jgi:hypothetical protein